MSHTAVTIALLIVAALIVVVRFEMFCISDLAKTQDHELLYLSRRGWSVAILFSIPLGGIAYLMIGKAR
jgi:hypothetical protein